MLLRLPKVCVLVMACAVLTVTACDDGEVDGNVGSAGFAGTAGVSAGGAGGAGGDQGGVGGVESRAGAGGQVGVAGGAGTVGQGGEGGQADTALTDEELGALCEARCEMQSGLECLDAATCEASCIGSAAAACGSAYSALLRCSAPLAAEDWGCVEDATVPVLLEGTECESLNCEYVTCLDVTLMPDGPHLFPQYEARCYP